MAASEILHSSS